MNCTFFGQTYKNFTDVTSIMLPAWDGICEILPNHAESFIRLIEGTIVCQTNSGEEKIATLPGICYVSKDVLIIQNFISEDTSASSQS